jgi:hypothetical protein
VASIVVLTATPKEVVRVRVSEVQYTFTPGVPKDVPNERRAAITAALQAVEGNLTSPTPTVTPTGGAAATQSYQVVAFNANGDTTPSSTVTTNVGPTTLSGTAYNTISWSAATGVGDATTGYKVIRVAGGPSQGLIATLAAGTLTYRDTGTAATTYTAASSPVGATQVVSTMGEL